MRAFRSGYLALPLAVMVVLLSSQQTRGGILTGKVTNPNSAGVANVKIEFFETATGTQYPAVGNLTDAQGNYGVFVPDGTYDVEYVTPVIPGGIVPIRYDAMSIVGTVTLNVNRPFGKVLSGTVLDTLGAGVDAVDINVTDAISGILEFTPNDNTDVSGNYGVIIAPGIKVLTYRPVAGTRLAAQELLNVSIANDTAVNVSLPAGVFVSGRIEDNIGNRIQGVDLDFDVSATGVRLPTPGDKTDNNGDYQVTVPVGVYDISAEPLVQDRLVAQRVFSVAVNQDTIIDWFLQPGLSLSGTVTAGGPVADCDIDVIDAVTLAKLVTPGDKTDATGLYEVIVPAGTYEVDFQPPVATHLVSIAKTGVHVGQDTVVNATLVSGVLVDGTVRSVSNALVPDVDLDIFDAITKATILVSDDKTNANGNYAIVIPSGSYDFEFEAPKSRRLIPLKQLGVAIPGDMTRPIVLDTGLSVSGTVTGAGLPIPDVDVDAIEESSGQLTFQPADLTNASGNYEVIVDFTPHTIAFYPPVASGYAGKAFTGINPGSDLVLNVALTAGFNVSGTIRDQGGAVFPGVTLRAITGGNWAPTTAGTTGPGGTYSTRLASGVYDFLFIPPSGSGLDTLRLLGVSISNDAVVDAQFGSANQRPTLAFIGPKSVAIGQNLGFNVSASDPETPAPQLSAAGLPPNASFNDNLNGTGSFSFTPAAGQVGQYPVVFIASDGALMDSESVTITVTDPTCDCPLQLDIDANGFADATDLAFIIDIVFFGGLDVQDPTCPVTRTDYTFNGFADATDLAFVIDYVFFGGPGPVNLCGP